MWHQRNPTPHVICLFSSAAVVSIALLLWPAETNVYFKYVPEGSINNCPGSLQRGHISVRFLSISLQSLLFSRYGAALIGCRSIQWHPAQNADRHSFHWDFRSFQELFGIWIWMSEYKETERQYLVISSQWLNKWSSAETLSLLVLATNFCKLLRERKCPSEWTKMTSRTPPSCWGIMCLNSFGCPSRSWRKSLVSWVSGMLDLAC